MCCFEESVSYINYFISCIWSIKKSHLHSKTTLKLTRCKEMDKKLVEVLGVGYIHKYLLLFEFLWIPWLVWSVFSFYSYWHDEGLQPLLVPQLFGMLQRLPRGMPVIDRDHLPGKIKHPFNKSDNEPLEQFYRNHYLFHWQSLHFFTLKLCIITTTPALCPAKCNIYSIKKLLFQIKQDIDDE